MHSGVAARPLAGLHAYAAALWRRGSAALAERAPQPLSLAPMPQSKVVLADWKAEGRQAWMGACRALLEEAGL